ncbi:MAG: helix-turn-helix transcriptional regulator [Bacteroidales bacterium]|nr:helix-turn-helix transcriptional regulator [Bacteroidales bacterium]
MYSSENLKTEELIPNYHGRIKSIRESKNLTQEHIANKLNISQRAYSSIENGKTQLTVDRLFEIADALQVSVGTLMSSDSQSVYYNNFNNHSTHNNGNLVFNQDTFNEQKKLYERLLQAKEDEIIYLKELLNLKTSKG